MGIEKVCFYVLSAPPPPIVSIWSATHYGIMMVNDLMLPLVNAFVFAKIIVGFNMESKIVSLMEQVIDNMYCMG